MGKNFLTGVEILTDFKKRKLIDTGVRVGLLLDNGNLVMDGFSLVETRVSGYWMF